MCAEWLPLSEFHRGGGEGGEEDRREGRQETGPVGLQQAACIWKVTVKCVVDSSSVVSVRGLERNV